MTTPQQLTSGNVRDSWPRLSPDGTTVAFIRSFPDEPDRLNQLCLVRLVGPTTHKRSAVRTLGGGTMRRGFGSISEVAWSPDGSKVAFVAEVDPPRFATTTQSAPFRIGSSTAPLSRHITRTDYRWDEVGYHDRWSHLFVVETANSGPARQLTSGDFGVEGINWHPRGTKIAFAADRSPTADLRPCPSVWQVTVPATLSNRVREPQLLMRLDGGVGSPAFSPNGKWVAGVGFQERDWYDDTSPGLFLAPSDRSMDPWPLSPDLDRPIGSWVDTDLNGWMVPARTGPQWADSETIVAIVTDRGRSAPAWWRIDAKTGETLSSPSPIGRDEFGPALECTTHSFAVVDVSSVAALATLDDRAMDVTTFRRDGSASTHTTFGSAWQKRYHRLERQRLDIPGSGGPIETWVFSPPGTTHSPLPTIINIHGGPLGGWAPAPGVEAMVLGGAGYRVVAPNIRGSAGYGAAWIRPHLGNWGGVDADDVHSVVDAVIERGLADPTHIGVLGLSYGGFLVNWLVGTTSRFAVAVSENGVTNQVAAWANSDSGPEYNRAARLGDPLTAEGIETLWRQSPLRHVANVHTPLLMLQAGADHRCPAHDNEQFFLALRHLGKTVEYVLYPDEYHVYATAGRPDRRIDRMQRVIAWFDQYLK